MNIIKIHRHFAGFFSTTTIILFNIIYYFQNNGINPDTIDSSNVFNWHRYTNNNIFFDFFKIGDIHKLDASLIGYNDAEKGSLQFKKYVECNLDVYFKYVNVYFNLSDNVMYIYQNMIDKYNINYDNICCLFLRGNDKATECAIPSYDKYIKKGKEIIQINPNIIFLIQSDEKEFIDEMILHFPNNIIFKDEIRIIPKNTKMTVDNHGKTPEINHKYALNFLAIVYIMSKCKYVVCNSGNISFWILMYRQHFNNFIQLI